MSWLSELVSNATAVTKSVGQNITGQTSIKEAKRNRDFQERMSSSAHQRQVMDLKAAGLNPILSAGGGGASTPSGSMATIPQTGQNLSSAAAVMVQRKVAMANVRNINAIAAQAEVDARMQSDMYDLYNSNSAVKKATLGGMLGKKAGVSPKIGAAIGGVSSAVKSAREAAKEAGKGIKKGKSGAVIKGATYLFKRGVKRIKNRKGEK